MYKNNVRFNDGSFIYIFILAFSFFPYITFYSFGSDIQPWSIVCILLMSLLLFYNNIKLNKIIIFLFFPFLSSFLLLFVSPDINSGIRSVLGYLTIFLVPFIFYIILNKHYELYVKFLKATTVIYFVVGLIQLLFYNNFMAFLLNRASTSDNRGVTSLGVEPTFYGIICLFLILLFLALDVENKKKYIYLLLFQIFFLAQSSMTIVFLLIYLTYYLLFKINFKITIFLIFSISIFLIFVSNIELSSYDIRVFQLLNKFLENPSSIIIMDASINDRVSAIYFSIKGFFDNYMLPNGFGTYSIYLNNEVPKQEIFWWVSVSNRIMSYYGSIFFELGFIAFIIPFVYSTIIYKAYRFQISDFLLYLFFINTILLSAIPLSFPFVGIYIATLLYKAHNYETLNNPQ